MTGSYAEDEPVAGLKLANSSCRAPAHLLFRQERPRSERHSADPPSPFV